MGNSESRDLEIDEKHRELVQLQVEKKTKELKSEVKSFKQEFPEEDVIHTIATTEDVLILRYGDAYTYSG